MAWRRLDAAVQAARRAAQRQEKIAIGFNRARDELVPRAMRVLRANETSRSRSSSDDSQDLGEALCAGRLDWPSCVWNRTTPCDVHHVVVGKRSCPDAERPSPHQPRRRFITDSWARFHRGKQARCCARDEDYLRRCGLDLNWITRGQLGDGQSMVPPARLALMPAYAS